MVSQNSVAREINKIIKNRNSILNHRNSWEANKITIVNLKELNTEFRINEHKIKMM